METLSNMTKGSFLKDEAMAKHTSYRIGGPANAYITPRDKDDLSQILQFANQHGIATYFVGSGSNLLVADEGIDGLVITLGKSLKRLEITGATVFAESGVMLGKMVKECIGRNLSGVESMVGVPGTLGGALVMNAGAFGGEISNYLKHVTVMEMDGQEKQYQPGDISFSYRHSTFPDDEIVISAEFELIQSDKETVQEKRADAKQLYNVRFGVNFCNGAADFIRAHIQASLDIFFSIAIGTNHDHSRATSCFLYRISSKR